MASSSYYFNLMMEYKNKKVATENTKKSYETFLKKLKKIKNQFNVSTYLKRSENFFSEGGYIDTSGTLDRGKLKELYNNLEKAYEVYENILKKTEAKINDLVLKINEYNRLYNQAQINYNNALRSEMMSGM